MLAVSELTCFLLATQRAERRAYYGNCFRAEREAKHYLSLILDGMDQSKTNIPHANCLSKVSTISKHISLQKLA